MAHRELRPPKSFEFTSKQKTACGAVALLGALVFVGAALTDHAHAAWNGYLIGFWFTLSLALSGPFILATQHLSIAGWSSTIRRLPEAYGAFLPAAFIFSFFLIVGGSHLYHWWDHEYLMSDPILAKKEGFLNVTTFVAVMITGFIWWIFTSNWLRRLSHKQDEEGGKLSSTLMMQVVSVFFLLGFILFFSMLCWYLIMGLEPHWFSTMFSVYAFAGLFQSGLALTIVLTLWLRDNDVFGDYVGERQIHDLGQLLFGFTVFYAYIGFSQFMLIWYANIPEEAIWYVARGIAPDTATGWEVFSLALPILKFVVPFLVLLPQANKKNKYNILRWVAFGLLFLQFYEVWYWVAPTPGHGVEGLAAEPSITHALIEWAVGIGFVGLFMGVVLSTLSRHPIVPKNDPFLNEATKPHHHGVKPPKPREMIISK